MLFWGFSQSLLMPLIPHQTKTQMQFWSLVEPRRYSCRSSQLNYEKLSDDRLGKPSAVDQARVEAAREIQHQGFSRDRQSPGMEDSNFIEKIC
jgi:hypothetical protein